MQLTDAGLHPQTGELSLDLIISTEPLFARDWATGAAEAASFVPARVTRPRVSPGEAYDDWQDPRAIAAFRAPLREEQLQAGGETQAESAAGFEGAGSRAVGGWSHPDAEVEIHILRLQAWRDDERSEGSAPGNAPGGSTSTGVHHHLRGPPTPSSSGGSRGRTRSRSEPRS